MKLPELMWAVATSSPYVVSCVAARGQAVPGVLGIAVQPRTYLPGLALSCTTASAVGTRSC